VLIVWLRVSIKGKNYSHQKCRKYQRCCKARGRVRRSLL